MLMLFVVHMEMIVQGQIDPTQCYESFFLKGGVGGVAMVSGTSLTNGLIQSDHDTKQVGAEKDEKKK